MSQQFVSRPVLSYWLYLGIVMVLAMVVIGGMTRLTHSGLSMVHWSFTGSLPPMNEHQWEAEFVRYQASPEFKEVHSHFDLSDFKSIYWWEYIHRMFGRTIGVVFIVPFVFFLWKRWIPKPLYRHFFMILGLGAFQAFLGWFMVKSGLVDVPRVSHYRLAAHLSTAFVACAYIYWVALKYKHFGQSRLDVLPIRREIGWLSAAIFIQIIYGGFVAGLRAGWIHNTWPLMDGSMISPAVTALDPLLLNFFEGRSGVQFVHRTLGLVVLFWSIRLWWRTHPTNDDRLRPIALVAMAVLAQFVLGVSTLLLEVPIALGVVHQVMAMLVLLSLVKAYYASSYRAKTASESSD
jgi:cytochrome c oxidase assembly protein subunit 15